MQQNLENYEETFLQRYLEKKAEKEIMKLEKKIQESENPSIYISQVNEIKLALEKTLKELKNEEELKEQKIENGIIKTN